MFLTTAVKLHWRARNYWCTCDKHYSLALELCLLGWYDSQYAQISLSSLGQAWATAQRKCDRSSPSASSNELQDSDTLFGTRLQKASTMKDLLSQRQCAILPHHLRPDGLIPLTESHLWHSVMFFSLHIYSHKCNRSSCVFFRHGSTVLSV